MVIEPFREDDTSRFLKDFIVDQILLDASLRGNGRQDDACYPGWIRWLSGRIVRDDIFSEVCPAPPRWNRKRGAFSALQRCGSPE